MPQYRLTRPAVNDIEKIGRYLLEHASSEVALRTQSKLFAAFDDLLASPSLGHHRPDVRQRNLLFYPVHPYLIAFQREVDSAVLIVRVLHGHRNLPALLR